MPAYGNFVLDKGYPVAAAITKYRAVKMSGTLGKVTPVTAATDQPIGVAQYSVSAGELANAKRASVRLQGITEMECSAAVTEGVEVGMATDGRAKAAATGERVIGTALSTTANAGERLAVSLTLPSHLKP